MADEPCTALDAVARAMGQLGRGNYVLGAGDYHDAAAPFTYRPDVDPRYQSGCDCWGLIAWAWRTSRHRPGFNRHTLASKSSVVDDMNVDSVYEDARWGVAEFARLLADHEPPQPGDLILTRSIRKGDVKHAPEFSEIGHVRMVTKAPVAWDPLHPLFVSCTLVEMHGGPGAVGPTVASGQHVDDWNRDWPTPDFRAVVVRPHERV